MTVINDTIVIEAVDETSSNTLVLSENLTTASVGSIVTFETAEPGDIFIPNGVITKITKKLFRAWSPWSTWEAMLPVSSQRVMWSSESPTRTKSTTARLPCWKASQSAILKNAGCGERSSPKTAQMKSILPAGGRTASKL